MTTLQYYRQLIGGIKPIGNSASRSGNIPISFDATLVAAKAGTLSTRTSNTVGVATVATGHGILTTDKLDVYWNGGRRYNCTVSAVTATTISFDSGAGDNLPALDFVIAVCKQTISAVNIDGDAAKIIAAQADFADPSSTEKSQLTLTDSGGAIIAHIDLTGRTGKFYDIEGGDTNIFAGNPILAIGASNGSILYSCNMLVGGIQP